MNTPRESYRSVGADIGSRAIKVVFTEQVADRVDLLAADSFAIPAGLVQKGVVIEPRSFGRHIAPRIEESGYIGAPSVLSIPSNLATLRWINLPRLAPDELRQAAQYKVRRHLPFPIESAYIEASMPVMNDDEDTGPALVIAVPKEVVDSRAEALSHAGLNPIRAELEAQAILRVVERKLSTKSVLWRDASLTIIDVGGTNTHMYVVQNQRLQFIRGVKFGGDLFTQAIAGALSTSQEHAESLIGHPNTRLTQEGRLHIETQEGEVLVNVQSELEKLTREFLRLLRYFRSLHPERSYAGILDHVILCGGVVGLAGFSEYLEAFLGLRVEPARPLAGMVAKLNREAFAGISGRQEAFTVVVGLALSGLSSQILQREESNAKREFAWTRTA